MKKIIFATILTFASLATLTAFQLSKNQIANVTETGDCRYGQCGATKDDGDRCKNCCQKNSAYCWSHR